MSGVQTPPGSAAGTTPNDPSMEDILASIRRILSEDEPAVPSADGAEAPASVAEEPGATEVVEDDVLVLDDSMLVPEPASTAAEPEPEPGSEPEPEPAPIIAAAPEPAPTPAPVVLPPAPELIGPEAAAAATSSVGALMRTLAVERSTQVYHGGPTIEDVVREEVRPLLKQWLDQNLPPLVERLVRVEIERVVGRAVP
jgi:hypothetical protein